MATTNDSRYCTSCGQQIEAARFCGSCGAPREPTATPADVVSPAAPSGPEERSSTRPPTRALVALGLVGVGLAVCIVIVIVLGTRGDRLDGDDLEGLLRDHLISMGADPDQVGTIRCAHSKSYGDGDTAECIADDLDGDSATLTIRVFEEGSGWRLQLDADQ
jgi:hypothetical protein